MDIYSYHEGEINKKRGETPLKHPALEAGGRIVFEGVDRVASGELRPFNLPLTDSV